MDGVTLGHPRCNVPQCTGRLSSARDRFCPTHILQSLACAVIGCELSPSPGFRTCAIENHRAQELLRNERGKSIFRLKARLGRPSGSASEAGQGLTVPSSSAPGVSGLRALLSHKWTNNELLMVSCCGIIKSRATCFQAESISNAKVRRSFKV
jgi:hypothetical protein